MLKAPNHVSGSSSVFLTILGSSLQLLNTSQICLFYTMISKLKATLCSCPLANNGCYIFKGYKKEGEQVMETVCGPRSLKYLLPGSLQKKYTFAMHVNSFY